MSTGRRCPRSAGLLLGSYLLALGLLVAALAGASGAATAPPPDPDPGTVWFGPALDFTNDSAGAYERRFGAEVSLVGQSVGYPLNSTSELLLGDLSAQSAQAGAVAVLTIEPADITRLTDRDAADLAAVVAADAERDDSFLLLRFAPEMNGSWAGWSRRPLTFVATFRALADAVHAATDSALMVWSPAYGADYPFSAATNATAGVGADAPPLDQRNLPYLDTDGDGAVSEADDPYGPYYPGDEYVDWVGLTLLRYDGGRRREVNTVPHAGELDARFKERFGYDDRRRRATFYVRFAGSRRQPLLLTTAAAYDPQRGGSSEEAVKQEWVRQVAAAVATRPMLRAVQWWESSGSGLEAGGTVRWQITDQPGLASLTRAALEQGAVTFGPLAGIGTSPAPDARSEADEAGGPPSFLYGVLTSLAVMVVAVVVGLRIRRRRRVPTWLR